MLTPKSATGRNWRASMAQDVAKGRRSEIEQMNGHVVARGLELGVGLAAGRDEGQRHRHRRQLCALPGGEPRVGLFGLVEPADGVGDAADPVGGGGPGRVGRADLVEAGLNADGVAPAGGSPAGSRR